MNRREDQIILIKMRRPCLIARGLRGIERDFGKKSLARGIATSNLLELDEIGTSHHGILMNALEMRIVPKAGALQLSRPARLAEMKLCNHVDERTPIVASAGR